MRQAVAVMPLAAKVQTGEVHTTGNTAAGSRETSKPRPKTQRVMFFKNQDLFQAPAIRIYVFCQSSGWQVMRTQEQKEENTGKRQMQI
nr:hypothetical protein [Escherichia coli]